MQLRQFKLTNGEEIVCEVVVWPSDDIEEIVAKKCLKILVQEDYETNTRYYSFKPWLVFADNPDDLCTINPYHIVGEANPSKELIKHWSSTIKAFEEDTPKENRLTEEENDILDKVLDKIRGEIEEPRDDNVIKFKPKGTLH